MAVLRFRWVTSVSLVFCIAASILPLRGDASVVAESGSPIGVVFWHRRDSTSNRDEYDPKFPERYERLELDEWSPDGWRPRKVDIVLKVPDEQLKGVSAIRTTISMRVGPLVLDPKMHVTDVERLEAEAIWLPAHFVQSNSVRDAKTGSVTALIRNLDLEELTTDLWKRGLWPVELKIEVVFEPIRRDHLREAISARVLKLQPGD